MEGEWVMAADTYSLQALVLRKTKLGETDLIVTLLAQDGRQVRAVAKGARKPNSSFASRLEIFSEVDLLLVCGKSLDIVKEAKTAQMLIIWRAGRHGACRQLRLLS